MFLGKLLAVLYLCFWVDGGGPDSTPVRANAEPCWATGNWSCAGPEPYLLIGSDNAIVRMRLDGEGEERVVSEAGQSILLDVQSRETRVYWVDTHTGGLSGADLDGTHRRKILSLGKGISGLAVDWIQNSVYWSNRKRGTIRRADTDGKNQKLILRELTQPSSVTVDPNERFLFWLSAGVTPSIQRSDLAGGMRTTVLKVPDRLLALAVDHTDNRLFWVQKGVGKLTVMGSCDYNGNLINVVNLSLRPKPLRMSVFLDHVYVTSSRSVTRVNKNTGGPPERFTSKNMRHAPTDLRVVHPINQPVPESSHAVSTGCDPQTEECVSVCSTSSDSAQCKCRSGFTLNTQGDYCQDINECALWNHGCSLGCENVVGSYFCTCPKGYLLLPDAKTCQEIEPCVENSTLCDYACTHMLEGDICVCPVGSMLQPDGRSCTGCLSADRGGCSQVCVTLSPGRWECECQPGYQLQPDGKQCKATGPPADLIFANKVDIRRVSTNGSGVTKVLEESRGSLIAVDYDPIQNKVYFTNKESKQIERISMDGGSRELLHSTRLMSAQGLALDWVNRRVYWTDIGLSTISRSALNGQNREVVIYEKELKPSGIAVHPQAQKVFWTDSGSRPAVERSGLDGEGREVLVSAGLVSPSGLAVDYTTQRIYWCDIGTGLIESSSLDGTDRHTLRQNQVGRPFDVAVFEDSLWVSNWEDNHIYLLSKRAEHEPERLHVETVRPSALVIVHPLAKPGADLCLHRNGGCSHLCESRFGLAHCSCHSQHVLSADRKTCLPTETASSESGEGEWSDHPKNKSLNDESSPVSELSPHAGESATFTEKMVSDQDECFSLRCDVNAQCLLQHGSAVCNCLSGFTGDGHLCIDINECTAGLVECDSALSECVNTAGGYSCQCRQGFSGDGHHCIDIEECRTEMHGCDVNAECWNTVGGYECRCKAGYTGSGFSCHARSSSGPSGSGTVSTPDIRTPPQPGNVVESCPSTHESYCLYNGVCLYFSEMESYGCNCMPGYMGERCQFSDLEWWELQEAKQEKKRNVAIAVCMTLLTLLLTITASLTCYYRYKRWSAKRPTVDSLSETSTSEDSVRETQSSSTQCFVMLGHGVNSDGKMLHMLDVQRRAVCPYSSETDDSFVSDSAGTLTRDKRLTNSSKCQSVCDIITKAGPLKPSADLISLEDVQSANQQLL